MHVGMKYVLLHIYLTTYYVVMHNDSSCFRFFMRDVNELQSPWLINYSCIYKLFVYVKTIAHATAVDTVTNVF